MRAMCVNTGAQVIKWRKSGEERVGGAGGMEGWIEEGGVEEGRGTGETGVEGSSL